MRSFFKAADDEWSQSIGRMLDDSLRKLLLMSSSKP